MPANVRVAEVKELVTAGPMRSAALSAVRLVDQAVVKQAGIPFPRPSTTHCSDANQVAKTLTEDDRWH
ncbi:MAG: hypothetical protein ACI9SE_004639 [Neolewinella sp.]|jgi:hypothetical protein